MSIFDIFKKLDEERAPAPVGAVEFIICGLGNPGTEYAATRHNVGFMLADALAARWDAAGWRMKQDALVAEARLGAEKILLEKPLTYMNESGRAVGPLLSWYKLAPEDLIVAHDDMDLHVGTIRLPNICTHFHCQLNERLNPIAKITWFCPLGNLLCNV